MSLGRAVQIWKVTSLVLAGFYAIAAFFGVMAGFDKTQDTVLWVVLLGSGAVLILIGQRLFARSFTFSAVLVSLGAAVGAVPLFFTFLVPLACAVVIALSFAIARQAPSATA
jgi:uncharacterized BrkB/YihY/UPF0761 family membrane protein